MLNAIFDFNGTMFFDEAFQEKAWQQYMTEKLGRRITPEEFQTWIHGRNTGDTLEYFFGRPFPQQEADEEEEAEETIYRALCRQSPDYKLADGLVEFLDFLAAHKIPRTIATASCGNNVRFFFDTLGLDRWFDLDKVIYNGQKVDETNRSLEVYASIKEENVQFRPGMYVTAHIQK